jgi:CheY-like chemotaxis protein
VTDVTRQKQEEANNFRMQQLESLGTLAGGIAHDFNNVLTAIFGNVSVARELLTSDHVATSYLKNAEGAIDRATRLSRQLLTFAKGGVPVLEVVNLSQLIAEVTILDLSVRNVIPDFQIEPDLKNVLVDCGQLQQVFSNLVVNAADAMPEGGRICLSATNRVLAGDEIPGIAAGSYVQVTIRDEGEGISPHDSKRIFDPYFTTKPHGTGLGLATCYSIIKRHGGHIDLVSEVGAGTTAKILLPASATSGNDGSSPVAAEKDSVQESKRVLIMDDEVLILDVASGILRASGALVETCETSDAVVAAYLSAFEQQQPYDVVILDLTIRGGAGGEVAARRILEIDSDAIIICSSGYTDADVVSEFRRFGFEGIIKKPYTAADLREVVGRFPARRKLS